MEMDEEPTMEIEQGMFMVNRTVGNVLCCECGILIQPNGLNMCAKCLKSVVDITEGLQKQVTIFHCPECDRYLQSGKTWLKAQLESKELLSFCLKKLKSLNKVRLIHAEFIWTEPHSKRIKVRLIIQKEVMHGAIIEQSYIAEYVVKDQLCDSCSRVHANPDQWGAVVQLRQYVSHRRTFFYLEQLILKHDAAAHCIRITQMDNGIDFYFAKKSDAVKFLEFVSKVTPVSHRGDKQLVSHDVKSSTYNNKFTFSVTIPPVCREDLICLPPTLATSLGNIGPLVICTKVSNNIALFDPLTLRESFLDGAQYWSSSLKSSPLKSFLSSKELVEYIILHVSSVDLIKSNRYSNREPKYKFVDAQVARVYNNRGSKDGFATADFGKIIHVRTHLGHLLKDGDYALGYDLVGTNSNDNELDKYKDLVLPEVVLIKKSYREKRQKNRGKPRSWKLKSLEMEGSDREEKSGEYEKFLSELEENPALWSGISLYRNEEYQPDGDDDDEPFIPLEQLLADLDINDQESEAEDDDDDDDAMRD